MMQEIVIHDEYIKLGQALKLAGLVSSGIEAKVLIQDSLVKVNGEIEVKRGRKLYPLDIFELEENQVKVTSI